MKPIITALIVCISMALSACSAKHHKPHSYAGTSIKSSLSKDELDRIFLGVFDKITKEKAVKVVLKYKIRPPTIHYTTENGIRCSWEYSLNHTNLMTERTEVCPENALLPEVVSQLLPTVEAFLDNEFVNAVMQYERYVEFLDKKIDSLVIEAIGVPESDLAQIEQSVRAEMKKSADINYFLKHAWSKRKETYESSHLSEYINNQALRMLDHVQKYSFSNTRVVASSTNFQYLARDVGFDFTPEEFNFSDENLSVEVGPLEYNHFEITFTNKSDSFLEVTDLAGYYGERVEILLPTRMRSQFTLPPGSTLKETYGWLSLSNVHRDISKAPIQYGYSTAYALRNQSSKTLKEVKDYSVDNF